METGQTGEIGVSVIATIVLEQEHVTELELVPTQPYLVLECKLTADYCIISDHQKFAIDEMYVNFVSIFK